MIHLSPRQRAAMAGSYLRKHKLATSKEIASLIGCPRRSARGLLSGISRVLPIYYDPRRRAWVFDDGR